MFSWLVKDCIVILLGVGGVTVLTVNGGESVGSVAKV